MVPKDEFSVRLRAAMAAIGMQCSATELERAFNRFWNRTPISVQATWNWINGRTVPRNDKLQVLAGLLRTTPHALLYGGAESPAMAERLREWEDRITYSERETIEAFLRLPAPQRLVVRDVIATYAKTYGPADPNKK